MQIQKRNLLILIVICIVTLLPFLGMTEFNTKGAPREAVVSYTMLETGNWVLPRNYGGDIAFKPPFFHWSIAAVSSLFGGVTEYSSRVPSALALTIMMLGIYLFYAKRKDAFTALLTAGITLTCFEVHRAGFACRVDTVLTVFIVLAILQFYQWYEKQLRGIPWLAVLFMSCATLTKGPVGIILPCMVIAVFLWIKIGRFWKVSFTLAGIALLACILPGIWYYLAWLQGGDHFLNLMMEENFGRFLGKMSYESHENPAYYNVYMLLAGYLPWSLLGLFSLFCLRYRKQGSFKESVRKLPATMRNSDSVNLYSFLAITLIFIFYCIPASKRSVYLLPIYPFIGYFLAVYSQYLLQRGWKAVKAFGILLSCLALLLTLTFIVVKCGLIPDTIFAGKRAAENAAFLHALENVPLHLLNLLMIALPVAAVVWLCLEMKRNARKGIVLYALCGLLFTVFIAMEGVYQPAVLNTKSDKRLAEKVRHLVPEGPIYSYGPYFYSVNFYNGDRMAFFDEKLPEEGYLMTGSRIIDEVKQKYASQYDFEEIYVSTLRSCDTRDIVHILRFHKK